MERDVIRGRLDMMLLAVLEGAPGHGYAIIEELAQRSGGEVTLAEGTVYPALYRLERQKLVSSTWSSAAGRRRRIYQLTGAGRKALGEQRSAWRLFVRTVDGVLGGAE